MRRSPSGWLIFLSFILSIVFPFPTDAAAALNNPWLLFSLAECGAGKTALLSTNMTGVRIRSPSWEPPSRESILNRPLSTLQSMIVPIVSFAFADIEVTFLDKAGERVPDGDIVVVSGVDGASIRTALGAAADASARESGGFVGAARAFSRGAAKRFASLVVDPMGIFSTCVLAVREHAADIVGPVAETVRSLLVHTADVLRSMERDLPGPEGWPQAAAAALEAAASRPTTLNPPSPHAFLNPLEGGFAGATSLKKASPPAAVRCTLNRLSLRYPIAMTLGILLSINADVLSSSRYFLFFSGAALGATLVVVVVTIIIMRMVRGKRDFLGAAFLTLAGIGAAASSWRESLREIFADIPLLLMLLDNWWILLVLIALLGAAAAAWCCAHTRADENPLTKAYIAAGLRGVAALCILSGSQSRILNTVIALIAVGGPLGGEYIAWWLGGALLRVASTPETLLEFALKWSLGWCITTPRFRFVRALRSVFGCGKLTTTTTTTTATTNTTTTATNNEADSDTATRPTRSMPQHPPPPPPPPRSIETRPSTTSSTAWPNSWPSQTSTRVVYGRGGIAPERGSGEVEEIEEVEGGDVPPPLMTPELQLRVQRAVSKARLSGGYAGTDPSSPLAPADLQAIGTNIAQQLAQEVMRMLSPPAPAPSPLTSSSASRYSVPQPPRAASVAAPVARSMMMLPPAPSAPEW